MCIIKSQKMKLPYNPVYPSVGVYFLQGREVLTSLLLSERFWWKENCSSRDFTAEAILIFLSEAASHYYIVRPSIAENLEDRANLSNQSGFVCVAE